MKSITINGKHSTLRCHFDFYNAFRLGSNIVITLTMNKTTVDSCEGGVPESLSTGGFTTAKWLMKISCEFCSLSSVESIIIFVFIMRLISCLISWVMLFLIAFTIPCSENSIILELLRFVSIVSFSKSCLYSTREHQKTKLVFFRLDSNIAARVICCSVSSPHHYRGNSISTTQSKIQYNRMKIKGRIMNHLYLSNFFGTS